MSSFDAAMGRPNLPATSRARASSSTAETTSAAPTAPTAAPQESAPTHLGRQLRAGWANVLSGSGLPQQPPSESRRPPGQGARLSASDNSNLSRLEVQRFGSSQNLPPSVRLEEPEQRETSAQTSTVPKETRTKTEGATVQVSIKNVSATAAPARGEATPESKADEPPSAGPRPSPESGKGLSTPSRPQDNSAAANRPQEMQKEATKTAQQQSANFPQTPLGSQFKTVAVFQAMMGNGLQPQAPPEKKESKSTTDRRPDKEKEGDSALGASSTGPHPKVQSRTQQRENRGLQGTLSGSVGKREEGEEKSNRLSAGWKDSKPSDARLANGRVVTAQSPIHSPVLDENQGRHPGKLSPQAHLKQQVLQGQQLAEFALQHAGHSIESLLKKVYGLDARKQLSQAQAVRFLTLVLKLGGEFTFSHSTRVLELALDLADEIGVDEETRQQVELGALLKDTGEMALLLDEAPPEKLEEIGQWLSGQELTQAGLLHDIGKTQIPPEILYKPGRLTEEEYELMKLHPVLGEQMVRPIESLRHLCPTIRGHHERWDGKGYPDGLAGQQIPLGARIIAVADVFDALAAERPYKAGMPIDQVRNILAEGRGTHFDPTLADAFGRVIQRRYPELGNPFE